jgi:hypothetical protein
MRLVKAVMKFLGLAALYFDVLTRCNLKPLCNLSQLMEGWYAEEEPCRETWTSSGDCQQIVIEVKDGIARRVT